ncbi:MAG: ADOP family duplicated permease [Longimicrobiales bacterium]
MEQRPPRLAEWLLRRLLGSEVSTEFVVGDLREEFQERWVRAAYVRAALWYWGQALRIAVRVRVERRKYRAASWVQNEGRRGSSIVGEIMQVELRQAIRFLLRRPGFSGVIVLTVALAIAATTVAFAVVDGALLEPLPYTAPEQLVVVWERNIPRNRERNVVSPTNYLHWRESTTSFTGLGAIVQSGGTVTDRGDAERVGLVVASASLLQVLGAHALVGRLYREADDREGADPVVVLSEGYWLRRFGGDRNIIGQTLMLNGSPRTVIGVLSRRSEFKPAFSFSAGTGTIDVWLPPRYGAQARQARGRFLQVVARLRPGVTISQAQAEMSALARRARDEFPDRQAGWDVNVVPLRADIVGETRTMLLVIFGAVCFVLLIACANVANLLMTRATARQPEMAVRSALGAGRLRLMRQLLLESLLLATLGGVAGVGLAQFALRALIASAPDIPRVDAIALDGSVLGFALLATVITSLLFGLAPALHMAGANAASWLKDRGGASARLGARQLRGALVVVQVSLSLVLLIGAGLLVRSLANRLALGVGFETEQLLTADVELSGQRYAEPRAQALFFEQLVDRVRTLPGVSAVSAITFAPLTGGASATTFWVLDRARPPAGELPGADIRWVHRDYFRTLAIPIVAGQTFTDADGQNAPLRVVINETGARTLFPGESAVGRRIAMPWNDTLVAEIAGVVGDVRHDGPDSEPRSMLYWEHRQFRSFSNMTLIVRAAGNPTDLVPGLRAALNELDANLPLYNARTMPQLFSAVLARSRFATIALGLFALLALVLAGIGIYGVVSYATQQRFREIGIRMALGADRSSVIRLVVTQGVALIGIALVIGAAGAVGLSRLLGSLVFDVSTRDPLTFLGMAVLLGLVGFLASWLPARRASGIDPVNAIRAE